MLDFHLRKVHMELKDELHPFKCLMCEAEYGSADELRSHIGENHKQELSMVYNDNNSPYDESLSLAAPVKFELS